MGLAISTGFLADMLENDQEGAAWFRQQLALVNELLAEAGKAEHVEPETRGSAKARPHCGSFPYSFLHYLRRAFARVRGGQPVTPVVAGEDPAEDPAIEDASSTLDTHLLCHSDCEGFYVPVEFEEVLFDEDKRGLPGGMLGASVRLMTELQEVAPAIGITLEGGLLSDAEAEKVGSEDKDTTPFWRERLVWLTLYESARVSIENKCLLVFS